MLEEAVVPVRCPRCKVQGDLEDGCMKIPCVTPGCETTYCYICSSDLGREYNDPYEHFRKSVSCMLFVEQYHERDPSWPERRGEALERLHKWCINRNLVEARDKNPEAFEAALRSDKGQVVLRDLDLYQISFKNIIKNVKK